MNPGFAAVNAPGAHFAAQFSQHGEEGLDVFAIVGLHADGPLLSAREVRSHMRTVVTKHVFERGDQAVGTVGPNVPTWAQVNQARTIIMDAMNAGTFADLQATWRT